MRARCLVVPKNRGEEARRVLREREALLKHLAILREGDFLYIPVSRPVDLGYPVEEREFEQGFVAVRSYKDGVDVPLPLRRSLPSSFDVVGDIAVIRIPNELQPYRIAIAEAILQWNRKIRVVVQDRGVKGDLRIRHVEVIGGESRTTTTHVEHGLRYRIDLAHAYFSPRLASERQRIANLVREGEVVADPFAGVGPYAILIARRRRPREVHASDTNSAAAHLLRANVAANRADRVTVREGDARTILRAIAPVDRVILDLPHTAFDFLADALAAIARRGAVHAYRILERAEERETEDRIRTIASRSGFRVDELSLHRVRGYSPTRHQVAFDLTVVRG